MAWDSPNNFSFPLKLLCVEAARWKKLNSYLPLNQRYEYFFSNYRPGYQTRSRYQPNAVIENWQGLHPPLEIGRTGVPGAQIRFLGSGSYLYLVEAPESYPWTNKTELAELFPGVATENLPTFQFVCDAINSQTRQTSTSAYPSKYFGNGDCFRPEFILSVLGKSKLVWQSETVESTEFESFQRWVFLGAGRYQNYPDDRQADSQYSTGVFLQIPDAQNQTLKLYQINCGACCCCC
jgi:hypothetical protein